MCLLYGKTTISGKNLNNKHSLTASRLFITSILLTFSAAEAQIQRAMDKNTPHLEEILVTAEKRKQALSTLPLSINVINSKQLYQQNITQLGQVSSTIANFESAYPNGEVLPVFSIRGISASDYSTNQSSPIGIYHDEVYLSSNFMHGTALFDLQRIEVLKGPQGTLYGKNTTGGAINLLSKTPDFKADGYITATLGEHQKRSLELGYERPLIEQTLAARLALKMSKNDGFDENKNGENALSNEDYRAARISLLYAADNHFDALLRLNHYHSDSNPQAIIPTATLPGNLNTLNTLLSSFSLPYYQRPANFDNHDADVNKPGHMKMASQGLSLELNKSATEHLFTSITGFTTANYDLAQDSDGTPQELLELDYLTDSQQLSQEFRLSSLSMQPFGYIAGLYFSKDTTDTEVIYDYFHSLEAIAPGFNPPSTGFSQVQRFQQKRSSKAIYGQINYQLNDDTQFTAGLRYTEDDNSQYNVHSYMADYNRSPMIGLIPFNIPYQADANHPSQSLGDEEWTGTFKLDHQASDAWFLYAFISRGYRSSAFNGAAVNDSSELTPASPEYINAFEIGAKGMLLNDKLRLNAAIFHHNYHNLQFINVVNTQQLLETAQRARIQGIDADITWQPTQTIQVFSGLGFLNTEFTDGILLHAQGESRDLRGNNLPNAPEINANIGINYQKVTKLGTVEGILNYHYRAEQWFTAFNNEYGHDEIGQGGYSLLDAEISIKQNNSAISWALWGKNLSNKEYKVYSINLSENFGYNYHVYGAPRSIGLKAKYEF